MKRTTRSQASQNSLGSQSSVDSSQSRRRGAAPSGTILNRNLQSLRGNRGDESSGRGGEGSQENRREEREASVPRASDNVKLGAFVRAGIMKHEKMTSTQLLSLIRRCCDELKVPFTDELETEAGITRLRNLINDETRLLNLEVKKLESEFDGSPVFYFGPIKSNEVLRFQTYWSKPETELFNKLMKIILYDSADFWISTRNCHVESRKVKSRYNREEVDNFVSRLVKTGYFETEPSLTIDEEENECRKYTLGVRSIQEFMCEINESYPGILVNCQLCKKSLLHGYTCVDAECGNVVHIYCWDRYQEAFPDGRTCPKSVTGCKIDWTVRDPVKRFRT